MTVKPKHPPFTVNGVIERCSDLTLLRTLAIQLREAMIGGLEFLRLDIPAADGHGVVTQYYAPTSIFAIHPTTQAIAERVAQTCRPMPVERWELPADTTTPDGGPF